MTETAEQDPMSALQPDVLHDLHRRMVRIRLFEEEAGKLMEGGRMPGFLHLYVGQEAVAAGVMVTLRPDNVVTSTHRGHGHAVAKGADLRYMYAELFGKETGYCKGRGGSMHINDLSIGMLGANGIVGGGIPHAVGAAFAAVYQGQDSVAVPFFGDGATNIGAFHESANLAAVMHLPVLFVCENNGYAEFTSQDRHMLLKDVADRAASYGMPGEIVDGMDAVAVYLAARRLVERARARGPGAARGQDLPVLRPPGCQGPAYPVPHAGGDRHLEGAGRDHLPRAAHGQRERGYSGGTGEGLVRHARGDRGRDRFRRTEP